VAVDGDHLGVGRRRISGQIPDLVGAGLRRHAAGRDALDVARSKPGLTAGDDPAEPGELVPGIALPRSAE
jgi:hypothetical protein